MPILGVTPASTAIVTTVSQVITSAQQDAVSLVGANNSALLDYINRIQLDLLRLSRWRFLQSDPQQFSTVVGANKYMLANNALGIGVQDTGLGLADLDIVKNNSVINRTRGYSLYPSNGQPTDLYFVGSGQPTEWVLHPSGQFDLWPIPDQVYTIEFVYYKTRPVITSFTDGLIIPSQYFDVVVAGVNFYLTMYLSKDNPALRGDVAYWRGMYEDGKRQMIRDANLFPRIDYISPDPSSQKTVMSNAPIETSLP